MKTIKAVKMQGLGNDFVIVDYDEYEKSGLSMEVFAMKICNRNFGIGGDGLIIPNLIPNDGCDIGWYFYNSDGTSAQMCGNGMRCFAKYAYDKKLVDKKQFSVSTLAGKIIPEIISDEEVRVNMGKPIFEDEKIPFKGERKITIKDKTFEINPVSMGNPHCVIFTDENPYKMAEIYGPEIEKHPYFPQKTNTEFVNVLSQNVIHMGVYERGCGITLACGTGACASVVSSILNNLTENKVNVKLLGGSVTVEWHGNSENKQKDVFLSGRADYVFEADYIL